MQTPPGHSSFPLIVSSVIAISLHIMIITGLNALLRIEFPVITKTIPTVILTPRIAQKASQSEASSSSTHAERNLVATSSESEFVTAIPLENPAVPVQKESNLTPLPASSTSTRQSPNSTPIIAVPQTTEQKRNSPTQQQLRSLFKQNPTNSTAPVEQISTKTVSELSDYEKTLLTQLSKDTLYDNFHPVMMHNTKTQVDYVLSLRLFKNGAIRSASLIKSSGIPEIDQLAIQTAYQASPFPRPPDEDAAMEYRYQIPIIYDRTGLSREE